MPVRFEGGAEQGFAGPQFWSLAIKTAMRVHLLVKLFIFFALYNVSVVTNASSLIIIHNGILERSSTFFYLSCNHWWFRRTESHKRNLIYQPLILVQRHIYWVLQLYKLQLRIYLFFFIFFITKVITTPQWLDKHSTAENKKHDSSFCNIWYVLCRIPIVIGMED